jgi:hypothetical protein
VTAQDQVDDAFAGAELRVSVDVVTGGRRVFPEPAQLAWQTSQRGNVNREAHVVLPRSMRASSGWLASGYTSKRFGACREQEAIHSCG